MFSFPPGRDKPQSSLVHAFERALDSYDAHVARHSERVSDLARVLAAHLDLDHPDRLLVARAGVVHELCKLGLPRGILGKPGPLSPDERAAMERHPIIGADVLLVMSHDLKSLAAGVRAHHERWDGSGYPDGLAGEQIPLFGRLLAVVDVYDALTHPRVYRKGVLSPAKARDYLDEHAGTQFDPECVSAGVEVLTAREQRRSQFPAF